MYQHVVRVLKKDLKDTSFSSNLSKLLGPMIPGAFGFWRMENYLSGFTLNFVSIE